MQFVALNQRYMISFNKAGSPVGKSIKNLAFLNGFYFSKSLKQGRATCRLKSNTSSQRLGVQKLDPQRLAEDLSFMILSHPNGRPNMKHVPGQCQLGLQGAFGGKNSFERRHSSGA